MVDYKMKYLDLRSKFMKTAERFYRLGKEDGLKQGQQQAQQQQMQEQMMAQQQAAMGGQPQIDPQTGQPIPPEEGGMPGQEEMSPEDMAAMQEQGMAPEEGMDEQQGSELDQKINELQQLVSKGEKPKVTDLRKAVEAITDLRKSQKKLKSNHKQVVVSKQKDFVDGILKKWEIQANNEKIMDNLESMIESEGIKLD